MNAAQLPTQTLCGQLVVVGFDGAELPRRLRHDLAGGRRAGVILFRRNLPSVDHAVRLCTDVAAAAKEGSPPWIGVDQEGGRVRRLPPPALSLPSMRQLGALLDEEQLSRAASTVARELAVIGFNVNFAPVLDVDTNPANPVIGDRAFGSDPETVARCARAYLLGASPWVVCCGKHFPGHGDTLLDSHFDLPRLAHDRSRLDAVELAPFRSAIRDGIQALMSAHVLVDTVDPRAPATLSPHLITRLLRVELGFRGVLFSDDLEMKAIAAHWSYEQAAVEAVAAGCDVLLVCHDEEAQERAHAALVREAETSPAFRARCIEAANRGLELRRQRPPRPVSAETVREIVGGMESRAIADTIALALARSAAVDATPIAPPAADPTTPT